MPRRYKNVLVDFDGVIAHLDHAQALNYLETYKSSLLIEGEELLKHFFYTNPYFREIDSGVMSYSHMLEQIRPAIWRDSNDEWMQLWNRIWSAYRPCVTVAELLQKCQEQAIGVLVVSDNHVGFRSWLARHPALGYLSQKLLCSAEIGVTKPHYQYYESAAVLLNCPLSSCVYIDDSIHNVSTAQSFGIKSFHFDRANALRVICEVESLVLRSK